MENKENKENCKDKNLSYKIKNKLLNILGDDIIKIKINEEYDIPIYKSKEKKKQEKFKKILVMSGGGIKGIAHIGVLYSLEKLNMLNKFEEFAGTSVGALILGLYLVGYSPKELWEFILKFDLKKLLNFDLFNFFGKININKRYTNCGFDDGRYIDYVIKRLIMAKGFNQDATLRDLYLKTKKKFKFTTVCWNTAEAIYMSHDNFPNLEIWKALRMSSSIPIFYTKIEHNGLLYMDGGCIDNYPIQLYKDRIHDVLGIYLEHKIELIGKPKNIEEDLFRIYEIFNKGVNFGNKKGYEKYTININLDGIDSMNFNITSEQKKKIFMCGFKTIKDFFNFS